VTRRPPIRCLSLDFRFEKGAKQALEIGKIGRDPGVKRRLSAIQESITGVDV
tara:strand:- start:187 stop:342 length:156 start_codon:yes stop_codon:yes gene_type:complete